MPSSRSRSENRGVSLTPSAIALVDIGPGTFSASRIPFREDAAEPRVGEHRRLALNVPRVFDDGGRPGAHGLERGNLHHEIALGTLEQAGGRDREIRGIREAEVLVEAARDDCPHVGVRS